MTDTNDRKRGLGRGLSALMADVDNSAPQQSGARPADQRIPIENIRPNPEQPRRSFTSEQLEELASSIRSKGVIQPLIVRPVPDEDGQYEIVAGERRWRAAQIAKLHEIPVLVRNFDDVEVLEVAIIENIQRADLNPVEEATGYRQLLEKFGHTQEQLAEALGKSRSYIANLMRLLGLPDPVLDMVREGRLSAGHARALITSDDPLSLAKKVVAGALSVRATEKLVKKNEKASAEGRSNGEGVKSRGSSGKDADTVALERDLSAATGLNVTVTHTAGSEAGQVAIRYESLDQLDDLCRILSAS